ncbi:MAG: hypothetical protein BGO98_08355 [Myxococcales bacterium 68-20]|nr:MAG: hypothetical protein BGO98_08355 [Myxococcales bacterium 68-20]
MNDTTKKAGRVAAGSKRGVLELLGEVRRFERRLPHRPEKVWRALTDARELARWFPASVEGEREEGASLRFVFRDGEPDAEGRITECEPPRVLAYTMGAETLRWELAPIPEGTLLVFTTEVKVASAPANDNAIAMCRMAA